MEERAQKPSARPRRRYRMRTITEWDGSKKRVRIEHYLGFPGYVVRFTRSCSGCSEVGDYESPLERGAGCHECGYTGRRRDEQFVPFDWGGFQRKQDALWAVEEEKRKKELVPVAC